MAVDVTLNSITSGYNLSLINENFTRIDTALQDAVSRSGTAPNQMGADLDLNGYDLLNIGSLSLEGDATLEEIVAWSKEWAINPEDTLVSTDAGGNGTTDYSSLHWAAKSSDSATNAATSASNASTSETNAATSETNAAASEAKAEDWAQEAEDVEVEPGLFSAFHWAQKSQAFATGSADNISVVDSAFTEITGTNVQDVLDSVDDYLATLGTAAFEDVAVGGTGDLLRSDGDGSNLTGISTADQVARDMAIVGIIQSDLAGGVYGPIISYDFSTDSLATSTNATHDSGTESYNNTATPVQISQATGTAIGDMVNGGGIAAAFDSNTSQTTTACAYKTTSTSGYNNTIGKNWGASQIVVRAIYYGPSNAAILSATATTIKVQGWNGSSWVDVSVAKNTTTSNGETITFETSDFTDTSAYTQHRFNVNGNGSNAIGCSEAEFFEPGTAGNMTLVSNAVTLDTANPTDVSLYVNVTELMGADASINMKCRMSIDGGSTYTTAAVADEEYTFGTDVLLRFDADVSGQTGSSFVWEILTENNDEFTVYEPRCVPI